MRALSVKGETRGRDGLARGGLGVCGAARGRGGGAWLCINVRLW